jgi:hypothetical protein
MKDRRNYWMSVPTALGTPYHGLVSGGQLTLPNGAVIAYPQPEMFGSNFDIAGTSHLVRAPGVPPVVRTPEQAARDTANGHEWRDTATLTGMRGQLYGQPLNGWIYIDPVGTRWLVECPSFLGKAASVTSGSFSETVSLTRFGEFPGVAESHSYPTTLAGIGQDTPVMSAVYTDNSKARVESISSDGGQAIIMLYAPGGTTHRDPFGFLLLTISGPGEDAITTLSVLRTREQTIGVATVNESHDSVTHMDMVRICYGGTETEVIEECSDGVDGLRRITHTATVGPAGVAEYDALGPGTGWDFPDCGVSNVVGSFTAYTGTYTKTVSYTRIIGLAFNPADDSLLEFSMSVSFSDALIMDLPVVTPSGEWVWENPTWWRMIPPGCEDDFDAGSATDSRVWTTTQSGTRTQTLDITYQFGAMSVPVTAALSGTVNTAWDFSTNCLDWAALGGDPPWHPSGPGESETNWTISNSATFSGTGHAESHTVNLVNEQGEGDIGIVQSTICDLADMELVANVLQSPPGLYTAFTTYRGGNHWYLEERTANWSPVRYSNLVVGVVSGYSTEAGSFALYYGAMHPGGQDAGTVLLGPEPEGERPFGSYCPQTGAVVWAQSQPVCWV